jgi:hypothetical protein
VGANNVLSNGTTPTNLTIANTAGAGLNLDTAAGTNSYTLTVGNLQGGGVLGGNIFLGNGTGGFGSGGTLTIYLTGSSTFAGNITGNGNIVEVAAIGAPAGTTLFLTGQVNFNGSISGRPGGDPYFNGSNPNASFTIQGNGPGNGIAMTANAGFAALMGGGPTNAGHYDAANFGANTTYTPNANYTGNGVVDGVSGGGAGLILTISATASFAVSQTNAALVTFNGGIWDDVSLVYSGLTNSNNQTQAMTMTGPSVTTGNFTVTGGSSTTTTLIVNTSQLGDDGTVNPSGGATLTVNKNGVLAGNGFINPTVTVNAGGLIRGGSNATYNGDNGVNNYATLTLATANAANNVLNNSSFAPTNLTLVAAANTAGGGATLQVEVNGAGTANSTISLQDGSLTLGSASAKLGGGNATNAKVVNINLLDTTSLGGGSYTFVLVNTNFTNSNTNGNVSVVETSGTLTGNGSSNVAIDSGSGPGLGTNRRIDFTATNATITSWSLFIDANNNLDLSVTATSGVPEPEHILLMCVGVLLAGFAVRRRWQRMAAASVA